MWICALVVDVIVVVRLIQVHGVKVLGADVSAMAVDVIPNMCCSSCGSRGEVWLSLLLLLLHYVGECVTCSCCHCQLLHSQVFLCFDARIVLQRSNSRRLAISHKFF